MLDWASGCGDVEMAVSSFSKQWKNFVPESMSTMLQSGEPAILNFPLIAVTVLSLLLSVLVASYVKGRGKLQLPPGPFNWPVVGSMFLLGAEPHLSLEKLAHKYGPLMHMRLGSCSAIVVSNAEFAGQILKTHDAHFGSRPPMAIAEYIAGSLSLAPTSDKVKLMRKIINLEVLSPSRLKAFRGIREAEAAALVDSLWPHASSFNSVKLRQHIGGSALSTMCRTVLGKQSFQPTGKVAANLQYMLQVVENFSKVSGEFNIGDLIPWMRWLDLQGLEKQYESLREQEKKVFKDILEEREERVLNGSNHEQSFLDVLLQMEGESKLPDYDIMVLTWEMFGAGTDTLSAVAEWCFAYLMRYPHVMAKAQEELDKVVGKIRRLEEADLPNLPYLQAIANESQRVQPVVGLGIPHYNENEAVVAGYRIPAKSRVLLNQWAIMRDPASWENPLEFKPERFLGLDLHHDFRFIPFGGGRRGCPGVALGMTILTLLLGSLLHAFDWKLPDGQSRETMDFQRAPGLVSYMKTSLVAVASPRIPANVYTAHGPL